jgi:hypothetical protein
MFTCLRLEFEHIKVFSNTCEFLSDAVTTVSNYSFPINSETFEHLIEIKNMEQLKEITNNEHTSKL